MNMFICSSCNVTIVTSEEDLLICEVCGGNVFKLDEEDIDEVGR